MRINIPEQREQKPDGKKKKIVKKRKKRNNILTNKHQQWEISDLMSVYVFDEHVIFKITA